MKTMKSKAVGTKLASYAEEIKNYNEIVKSAELDIIECGYDIANYDHVQHCIAVEESSTLKNNFFKTSGFFKDERGVEYSFMRLEGEKLNAIEEYQFEGFASKIKETIMGSKRLSKKQFDILLQDIFNVKF